MIYTIEYSKRDGVPVPSVTNFKYLLFWFSAAKVVILLRIAKFLKEK